MTTEIRPLNTLRGIAAMIVVLSHFSGGTGWLGGYLGRGAGQIGVMLFFILSGFLMALLYLERPLDGTSLWRYVVARFARVVPLFAVVVGLSMVLPRVGVTGVLYDVISQQQIASHLLLLSGKNILWTIPAEIHFYVVFVFLWWLASKSLALAAAVTVGVAAVTAGLAFRPWSGETVRAIPYDIRLPQVVPYFLAGVLIAMLYQRYSMPRLQSSWWSLALLAIPLMYPLVFEQVFGFRHRMWNDVLVLAVIAAIFAVVVFLVPNDGALSNSLGDFLGRISYSLYLLHEPLLRLLREVDLPVIVQLVMSVGASIMLATLSFRLFERPVGSAIRARLLGSSEKESLRSPLG